MRETATAYAQQGRSGTPLPARSVPRVPVVALGMSLGATLSLTFVLCVLFDLWFPALAMNPVWAPLLPGFVWISWSSFLLGLIEACAFGKRCVDLVPIIAQRLGGRLASGEPQLVAVEEPAPPAHRSAPPRARRTAG